MMSALGANVVDRAADSASSSYTHMTAAEVSSFIGSSSSPRLLVSSRNVDVQTTASSLLDRHHELDTAAAADTPTSARTMQTSAPGSTARPQQLSTLQQQQIAEYIASEMKEKYMEQARTLEEMQQKMKEELQTRQAQLLQQLQRIDSAPPLLPSAANIASIAVANDMLADGLSAPGPADLTTDLTADLTSTPATPTNGHSAFHNGVRGSSTDRRRELGNNVTPSVSADGSLNGNISQGSSHDTWDSANAFAHERPVLTGSERSTPTATVLPSMDSSNDQELLSQSIHMPVMDDSCRTALLGQQCDMQATSTAPLTTGADSALTPAATTYITSNGNIMANGTGWAHSTGSSINCAVPVTTAMLGERSAGNKGVENELMGGDDRMLPSHTEHAETRNGAALNVDDIAGPESVSSFGENVCRLSESSTPPPESPADDLSASLRLSLRQKHSRHLADMKAYYEQELKDLKEKLSSSLAVSQHVVYQTLEVDNQKLRERCRILEEELLRANRYINSVDKQMEDLESSFTATMATSSRANQHQDSQPISSNEEVYKSKLSQAQSYIAILEDKNKELFSAVCDAYEVRDNTARNATQSSIRYEELKQRYEELKSANELTTMKLQNTVAQLNDSRKDLENLKQSVKRLEADHEKLAKDNEMLTLCATAAHKDSPSLVKSLSSADDITSPMLKAERQLERSSTYTSPGKHRNRHHNSDKSRQRAQQQSAVVQPMTTHTNDLNKQTSPQPLSDATQSSDNSGRDCATRQRSKHSCKRSNHLPADNNNTSGQHTVGKDDLISAYSPIVDRQRHSSSASSGGAAIRSASSPTRQSTERPYGYHHVGASMSPSKRTQQWAVLSPFNRNGDSSKRNREKSSQTTTQSAAMKNLNFSLSPPPAAAQTSKLDKDDVLDQVRTGKVFSEEPAEPRSAAVSKKVRSAQQDRLQLIKDAEMRLDELLIEKRQLESSLTRMSTSHSRKDKQRQETIERQLDKVDKDLGSVRMTLRRYNAL